MFAKWIYLFRPSVFVLCAGFVLSSPLFLEPAASMGLDWGGGDEGSNDDPACLPDDPLVIVPGPIGSPLRIAAFDAQTYLIVDYSRKKILWLEQSGALTPFFQPLGKPLSIALDVQNKPNGKLKEAYYYVGNDDDRTIDVYHEKNMQLNMISQHPIGDNGIQALDMEFSTIQNHLYVVDGLDGDVKVVQPGGQLVRSFGAGVLSAPKGIAVDDATGEIFVSDYGDPVVYPVIPASIKIFDMTGSHVGTISGSGQFSRPQGLALKGDKVYLADNMLGQILEFDRATGVKTASFGCKGSSDGHLLLPMDLVLGDSGESLYVADNRNMRITVLPLTQP